MQNLTEKFVKEVEQRILTGQWEIGMKIPSSRALADEFFVSRSVINAGIAELCCNGYLTTVPKGSVYVADWRKMGNFALIGGLIDNDLVDLHAIDSLLEGRMAIYKVIVRKPRCVPRRIWLSCASSSTARKIVRPRKKRQRPMKLSTMPSPRPATTSSTR